MNIRRTLIPLLLPVLFSSFTACTKQLAIDPVMNRFEVPETGGGLGKVVVSPFVSEAVHVVMGEVGEFQGEVLSVNNENRVDRELTSGINTSIGLHNRVDIYMHLQAGSPTLYGIRTDLIGRLLQKLHPNIRLTSSIAIGGGSNTQGGDVETKSLLYSNKYSYHIKSEDMAKDISLNSGYRINNNFLIYTNIFYSTYSLSGRIYIDDVLYLENSGSGEAYGILPGLMFGDKEGFSLIVEGGRTWLKWTGLPERHFDAVGTSLKYSW